jgi:hypothetical protein
MRGKSRNQHAADGGRQSDANDVHLWQPLGKSKKGLNQRRRDSMSARTSLPDWAAGK